MVTAVMKLKDAYSLEKSYDQPRQLIKKQRHYFANKGPSSQSYGFSSNYVAIWLSSIFPSIWNFLITPDFIDRNTEAQQR